MRRLVNSEGGNVAAISAISLFAIAVGAGFAMNANRIQTTGDHLQSVADAAALGAVVTGKNLERSPDQIAAAGRRLAASMLTTEHSGATVDVTVENRSPARVKVEIAEDTDVVFGALMSREAQRVTRTAVAENRAGEPVCLLVLNPTAPAALRLQGSPDLRTNACTVRVNSKAEGAIAVGGSAGIDATAVYVAGPASPDGKINPKPQYDQPVMKDPLAAKISWPGLAACDNVAYRAGRNTAPPKPGVYCGGMTFGPGTNVTLPAGVYVLQTGSLSFSANAKVRAPGGVTFVLLDPVGALDLQGGADVNLQPSTSGPWAGFVLAVKPQPTHVTSSLQGGNDLVLGGIVYMPSQRLQMRGGNDLGGAPVARGFVVDTLNMQGGGELHLAGDPRLIGEQANPRLVR